MQRSQQRPRPPPFGHPEHPLRGVLPSAEGGVEVLFKPAYVASIPPGFTGVC